MFLSENQPLSTEIVTPESIAVAVNRFQYDRLLSCLMFTVRHYRKVVSADTLTQGLPLKENKLTPALYIRAARRAGIFARIVERDLDDIKDAVLPVTLLFKNGDAGLLIEKTTKGDKTLWKIYLPDAGKILTLGSSNKLSQLYSGKAIYMAPSSILEIGADVFSSPKNWFWGSIKQFSKLYGQVILASIMINLLALASPLFVMNVYDRVVPNSAFETLHVLVIGVTLAFVFDYLLKVLRTYFIDVAGRGADILMAGRVYSQILSARMGQVSRSSGAFANQIRDYETIREFFASATLVTLIDLPFVFLFITIIAIIAGPVAWIPLLAVPLILFMSFAIQKPLQKLVQEVSEQADEKHSQLVEALTSLENVKALGVEGRLQSKWEHVVGVLAKMNLKARLLTSIALNGAGFVQQMVTVLIVIVGVYAISEGDMTVGALVAATILAGRTMAPLSSAAALYTRFEQSRTALRSLNEVMRLDVETPEGKQFVYLPEMKGDYLLKNVSFTYPDAPLKSLQNINLSLKDGEKIAIVGRAGSGKTTLLRMLMGLYQPTDGEITLCDVDMRQQDPATYRRRMAYVPQNTQLFKGSLRDNIMMADVNASLEKTRGVVEKSAVHHFVNKHPQGLDMPISEGGSNLSGGQRQTVALARAFLKDSKLLFMDEPTSHLDASTEAEVIRSIAEESKDKTLVLITHKLNLLSLVDRVIVMDDGKVVADGPKDVIVSKLQGGQVKEAVTS